MLRWLLLSLLLFGSITGIREGWIIVKWSKLFHDVGFVEVDPERPMDWNEFIFKRKN